MDKELKQELKEWCKEADTQLYDLSQDVDLYSSDLDDKNETELAELLSDLSTSIEEARMNLEWFEVALSKKRGR